MHSPVTGVSSRELSVSIMYCLKPATSSGWNRHTWTDLTYFGCFSPKTLIESWMLFATSSQSNPNWPVYEHTVACVTPKHRLSLINFSNERTISHHTDFVRILLKNNIFSRSAILFFRTSVFETRTADSKIRIQAVNDRTIPLHRLQNNAKQKLSFPVCKLRRLLKAFIFINVFSDNATFFWNIKSK